MKKRTRARSSKTGRMVSKAYAKSHPATTETEAVRTHSAFVAAILAAWRTMFPGKAAPTVLIVPPPPPKRKRKRK